MTQAERDEIRALVLSFSTKISDLPEVEALQDGDYVVVVQNDGSKKHSKKATLESLLELIKIYYPDHNGAKYQGVAHPNDNIVNLPIGTDGFWFAIDAGVYTNYGGIIVGNSPKTLLYNAETHEWTSEDLWGDINGTVGFRLMDSSIENSLETFRIPVIPNRPYIISADARPSGSFAVLNIYEYDYTGELIGSIGYHVPEHSFTPREGAAYIKIGLGYNPSNPIAAELSEVRVTSSIKTLIEGLTDFVVDVLQGEYATHFGNIEDNINAILSRVGINEANIAALQQDVSELGAGLGSLSDRTGIIAGDLAQLVIDTSGIHARLENAEQDIHELSITAEGLDERITNNQGDIFSLNTRATGLEVEVQNAKGDITNLQVTAQGLDTRITNAQGDVDELEITARGLSQRVSDAEGNIHTLESTATTLQSTITATDNRVSSLSQTVGEIDAFVQGQQGQIAGLAITAENIRLYAVGVAEDLSDYESYVDGALQNIEEQIDGAIDTWFYDYAPVHTDSHGVPDSQVPLTNVSPYADWLAEETRLEKPEEIRNEHVSDIFYDTSSGYAYRFIGTGEAGSRVYTWVPIEDSAVVKALEDAAKAQDTADSKRRVFLVQPTPPYDAGDLWVKEVSVGGNTTREIYRCSVSRASGSFVSSDWAPADDYGYKVNKANLEVLSNAIVGQVTQITYNADGTVSSTSASAIQQTAGNIRLQVAEGAIDTAVDEGGKIAAPLLNTGIDITNGNITLVANHISLKNQSNITGLELITVGEAPNQRVVINTGSLNVNGIFSTTPGSVWATQLSNIEGYADNAAGDALDSAKDYADDAAGDAYTNAVAQAATNASEYITLNVVPSITNAQTTANNAVTAAGNAQTTATNAQNDVNGLQYLATALNNGTTAIGGGLVLTSLVGLGGTSGSGGVWELWSGMNGQYSASAPGYGIGAWYGGDNVDCITIPDWATMTTAERLAAWDTYRYARSLFRLDGSGYLASGAITWGASGDLHLMDNIYIGAGTSNPFSEYLTFLTKLATWFEDVEETIGGVSRRMLRINMNGTAAGGTDFAGLEFNGFLITGGDQIVGSGTPGGGGGGGVDSLYKLEDVYGNFTTEKVKTATGEDVSEGQALVWNSGLSKWVAGTVQGGGSVTSVVGQTGDVTAAQISIAIGLGDYLPLAGGTMTGAIKMSYAYQSGANFKFIDNRAVSGSSGWADTVFGIYNAAESSLASIGVYGTADALTYLYIGSNAYNGVNLRINASSIKWGDNNILHAGNYSSYTPILNSASTHATSSSVIYAPTSAGVAGQILISLGTGAPSWTTVARGASNKPIYINSSGVLTEGVGCLPLSAESSYPLTGDLYLTAGKGIQATSGAGLLVYHPATGWAGVSDTQWAVGASDSQGVIRSGNNNLIHYRNGTNYTIWDGSNFRAGTEYVSITGTETITGTKTFSTTSYGTQITIKRNQSNYDAVIRFENATDGLLGYLGICGSGTAAAERAIYGDGTNTYAIYHSGNSNLNTVSWAVNNLSVAGNINPTAKNTSFIGAADKNFSKVYVNSVHPGTNNNLWILSSNNIYFVNGIDTTGTKLGTWTSTGLCVGADTPAYKLHVAGDLGVTGGITMSYATTLGSLDSGGTRRSLLGTDSGGTYLAYGMSGAGVNTNICGNAIALLYGTSHTTGMSMSSAGNVRFNIPSFTNFQILRTASGGSAAITYYPGNQTTNYWAAGADPGTSYQFFWYYNGAYKAYLSTSGTLTTTGDQVISSDAALKKNIKDLDLTVEQIAQLPAVTFDWKDGRGSTFGTVAQGVLPIFPQAVRGNEGNYSVVYGQGGWVFGVKNARAIVDIQAHETEQDKEIKKLKARVKELEKQLKLRN